MKLEPDTVEHALRAKLRRLLQEPATAPHMLAQLGIWGFSLPTEVGGLDLGIGTAVVAWEELGRVLAQPSATDTMFAADVVAAAGLGPGADWLGRVAAGSATAVLVGLRGAQIRAQGDGVHGNSEVMPAQPVPADYLVAVAQTAQGPTVFLISAASGGIRFAECEGNGGFGRYVLGAGSALRVTDWGAASRLVDAALPAARVRQAGYLVGAAERVLRLTVGHVRERQQFGRRLVDFQSVSLRLAEIRARTEATRMLVRHAGWCCDNGSDGEPFAAEALASAAELALHGSRTMMQLYGARGMLAASETAAAYQTVAREAVRFGLPSALWSQAGRARLLLT